MTDMRQLDRIAGYVDTAMKDALVAAALIRRPTRHAEDLQFAETKAMNATNAAKIALDLLQEEGARPDTIPLPPTIGVPLDKLDTPANRALLAALESVVQLAEKVDAERGLSVDEADRLGPNDTLGIDLAEQINQIRARVSLEIHGPKGKGLE